MDGKNVGNAEFGGGEAQDMTVNLWFDSTDDGSDVTGYIEDSFQVGDPIARYVSIDDAD